jgi:hypothetical protein
MKHKTFAILFAAVCAALLLLPACTTQEKPESPKQTEDSVTTLKGMVTIYGNEPRTWVGIETVPEEKVYAVQPPEKAAELRNMQGRLIEFTVIIKSSEIPGRDGTATVLSWR